MDTRRAAAATTTTTTSSTRSYSTPKPVTNTSIFREWKTKFEDLINGRDKELGKLLERSEQAKEVIIKVGSTE